MVTKEGQRGDISFFNSSYLSNLNESFKDLIIIARVNEILLSPNDSFLFNRFGGWNGIGLIKYQTISTNNQIPTFNGYALPLEANSKKFPLINELVYIIKAPNTGIGINPYSINAYYVNTLNLWNHPHHNAYPSKANEPSPPQQKDYIETQAGSVNIVTDDNQQIFLGKTFKERSNIHPLLPFEGDIIHEGRWGNSIRLSSTVKNRLNNWSNVGDSGDPIIIIKNGQNSLIAGNGEDITDKGWIPVVEDVNGDPSSIVLTSTQNIPLIVSSDTYKSYIDNPPTKPNQYSGNQIIINSGRLVFNSKNDHILLSSVESINLNSQKSINIDTKKFVTQADKIFLGREDLATQPLMLGNNTVKFLKTLIFVLKELTNTMKKIETEPTVSGKPAALPDLNNKAIAMYTILLSLEKELTSDPSPLISERNYTL